MGAVLVKALYAMLMKSLAAMASEKMLEWCMFQLIDVIVKSTKTKKDDAWAEKFKESYEQGE
jgi:hypothetical protein